MDKPEPPSDLPDGIPYAPAYDADGFDQFGYESPPQDFWHPHWVAEDRTPLPVLYTPDGLPVIAFDPVPQQRKRRIGWDGARQRAFVALLSRTPSVSHAARAVGMSPQSFYRLIERPGAESFAKAVDLAIDHGVMQLRLSGLGRSLGQDEVPVFRRGRHVRTEHRWNDRLAIAILRQAKVDPDRMRHATQLRWRSKREWASLDAEKAAKAALLVDHDAILAEAVRLLPCRPRIPGVRQL